MILRYRTIELFGKLLFETVVLTPPFEKNNPMINEACFLYIIEGEYESISEVERLRIKADESILMKCGNYLSKMVKTPSSPRYQALAVHFHPEVLLKIYDQKLPTFLKQDLGNRQTMVKMNSDVLLKKYIDSIFFYFDNPSLVEEAILILKLKEIILLLNQTKNAPQLRAVLANLFNPSTYTFREIVESHIFSTIRMRELAPLLNMSLSTFKRRFAQLYKMSPAKYLNDRRLEKARELLIATELQATEIAYDCGFNDISHFSRAFKKKYGLSPTRFRMNLSVNSLDS